MVQNAAKINKKYVQIFVIQYYGRLKELFDFNKLAKLLKMIIFRIILFYNESCNKVCFIFKNIIYFMEQT